MKTYDREKIGQVENPHSKFVKWGGVNQEKFLGGGEPN